MTAQQFSEFQEEIQEPSFGNPEIIFEFLTAIIISKPLLKDKIELGISSLIFILLFYGWAGIIFFAILLPVCLISFYSQFIGMNTLRIDFISQTVSVKNKFLLLEWRRKLLRMKTEFAFSDIIEIGHKHGPFRDRLGRGIKRRSLIYFETDSDWEIFAAQFSNEEEAESFVQTLRKFIPAKEKSGPA